MIWYVWCSDFLLGSLLCVPLDRGRNTGKTKALDLSCEGIGDVSVRIVRRLCIDLVNISSTGGSYNQHIPNRFSFHRWYPDVHSTQATSELCRCAYGHFPILPSMRTICSMSTACLPHLMFGNLTSCILKAKGKSGLSPEVRMYNGAPSMTTSTLRKVATRFWISVVRSGGVTRSRSR